MGGEYGLKIILMEKELHLVLVFHLIEQRMNLRCLHQFLLRKPLTVVVKTHIQVIIGPG
jgi:hypothetical protein